ncbi:MAG: hypothetical protein GX348_02410 [Veillonellaceae bacterium]|jgi:hypothetical protein|nr:hypothetical protein [Veillonellaceae bacterium]
MKISLPSSDNALASLNIQNNQQLTDSNNSSGVTLVKQTHFSVEQAVNSLLKEIATSIRNRENLINLLPVNLKDAAIKVIQQNTAAPENFLQGLAALASSQKTAADKLFKLIAAIQDAQVIKESFTLEQQKSQVYIQTLDDFWAPLLKADSNLGKLLSESSFLLLAKYISENTNLKQLIQKTFNQKFPDTQYMTIKEILVMFAKTAPESLVQFAEKNLLPELIMLWASIKLKNALPWLDMNTQQVQKSSDILQQLATSLQTHTAGSEETGATATNQKLFSVTIPLYFENATKPYPAYIHVYQDAKEEDGERRQQTPETWLRVCLSTENIGIVDIVFRLYQENLINVSVAFSLNSAANVFTEYLPEIETRLSSSTLKLTDIKVK